MGWFFIIFRNLGSLLVKNNKKHLWLNIPKSYCSMMMLLPKWLIDLIMMRLINSIKRKESYLLWWIYKHYVSIVFKIYLTLSKAAFTIYNTTKSKKTVHWLDPFVLSNFLKKRVFVEEDVDLFSKHINLVCFRPLRCKLKSVRFI